MWHPIIWFSGATIFCFMDFASIAPRPCDITTIPEWDFPLKCTPWLASAKHVTLSSLSSDMPRCIPRSCDPLKYLSTLSSFLLSCSVGLRTLMVKKITGSEASGLVLVTTYKHWATNLWNISLCSTVFYSVCSAWRFSTLTLWVHLVRTS